MDLTVNSLRKEFGSRCILKNISFSVAEGEILALVGPNGSGKSTLIKNLTLILEPTSGSILLDDVDIRRIDPVDLSMKIGYVPQHFIYTLYSTVFETVLLGRRRHIKWMVSDDELFKVQKALDTLEMSCLAGKYMNELSGGERQKVFIARALAQTPELFLFDEPTSALDIRYQIEVMETMRRITLEQNTSLIVAVHDLNLAYRYADRVLVLDKGTVAGYGKPNDVITSTLIEEVYGVESIILDNEFGTFFYPLKVIPT